MKQKHLFTLLDQSATTVRVVFAQDERKHAAQLADVRRRFGDDGLTTEIRSYVYKAPLAMELEAGDSVVVDTPGSGFSVGRVVEVHTSAQVDVDADFEYKWIVQKVDRRDYDARCERERNFAKMMVEVERTRQRDALVAELRLHLPAESEARRLFDSALSVVNHTPEAPCGGDVGSEASNG
jgi:hypothetical protein